jgi:hypothetical protein
MTEAHPLTDSHNHGNFTDDENSIESANTTDDGNDGFAYDRLQDQCRSCERELTSRIARVCGDNDGCVPECKHCVDYHITGDNQGRHNTAAIAFRAHAERDRDRGGDE